MMENRNKNVNPRPLVFTVNMPAVIAPSDSGEYVARMLKKEYNTVIVPYTIEAITKRAVLNQKEKQLAEVQLSFSPKSSPAKLSFKWISKKL